MNITENILNGDLTPLSNLAVIIGYVKNQEQYNGGKFLARGNTESDDLDGHTFLMRENNFKWGDEGAVYESTTNQLVYIFHYNNSQAGVNILQLNAGAIREQGIPCLISSGPLTGCTFAWFLMEGGQLLLLHSGADGDGMSSDEESGGKVNGDLLTAVESILYGEGSEADRELTARELLDALNTMPEIKAGQIISHVDNDSDIENYQNTDRIQLLTYSAPAQSRGECICCIPINPEVMISGMITSLRDFKLEKPHIGAFLMVNDREEIIKM